MSVVQRAQALSRSVALTESALPSFQEPRLGAADSIKRCMDIAGASLALLLSIPVMLAICAALLPSRTNPVFAQWRVGRDGRLFRCYKFRSMVPDANRILADHLEKHPHAQAEWNSGFKLSRDPRITRFGAFLRRTSLDELPQLFNILKGEMSLVGPRPIVPDEIERYGRRIHAYYRCRPGLTGLWQVNGRNLLGYPQRVRLDAFYARNQSFWMDAAILFRTVGVVVSGRGAW